MFRSSAGATAGVVAVVAETGLLGFWLTTGRSAVAAVGQVAIVLVAGLVVLLVAYRHYRRAFERGLAATAVDAERIRLGEELHDALGHDLGVIALRASAIQVRADSGLADDAGALRQEVERAVTTLHDTVRAIGNTDRASTAGESVRALVTRTVDSGGRVTLTGSLPAGVARPLERTTYAVVREGLTNAARHAPGAPVTVELSADARGVTVRVANPHAGSADPGRAGSGLAGLRRRVELLGGSLDRGPEGGEYVLLARLPGDLDRVPGRTEVAAAPVRRPLPSLLRGALVPLGVAAVLLVGFYTWATHDATLEEPAADGLRAGMSRPAALAALPPRQAPVRLVAAPEAEPGWECRYYTDGNVPFGMATLEVCLQGEQVARVTDMRRSPW